MSIWKSGKPRFYCDTKPDRSPPFITLFNLYFRFKKLLTQNLVNEPFYKTEVLQKTFDLQKLRQQITSVQKSFFRNNNYSMTFCEGASEEVGVYKLKDVFETSLSVTVDQVEQLALYHLYFCLQQHRHSPNKSTGQLAQTNNFSSESFTR